MGWKKSIEEQLKKHDKVEEKAKEMAKKRAKKDDQSAYPAVGGSYMNTERRDIELISVDEADTCMHNHTIPYKYVFYRGFDSVPMSNATEMRLHSILCTDCYSIIKLDI